jgi:hypothetical protein
MENSSRVKAKRLDIVQTQYNGRMREVKGLERPRDGESETSSNVQQYAPVCSSKQVALASPDRVKLLHAACNLRDLTTCIPS